MDVVPEEGSVADPANAKLAQTPAARRPRRAWSLVAAALGPCGWLLLKVAAAHPEQTESLYAARIFPVLQRTLATLSSKLPFSLGELLLAASLVAGAMAVGRGVRGWRRGVGRRSALLADWAWRLMALAGSVYFLFLLLWGLNHARPSYAELRGLDAGAPLTSELAQVGERMSDRARSLREGLEEDAQGVFRIADGRLSLLHRVRGAFERAAQVEPRLGVGRLVVRPALSSPLMTAGSLAGIYFPFTAEGYVNAHQPNSSLGFSACHEAAHASGFAREDEASFLGWLACEHSGDDELRYSGTLAALNSIVRALRTVDASAADELIERAGSAVQRDLEAQVRFWRRHRTPLGQVTHATNELYLRSSGRKEGTASYGRVVELLVAWHRPGAPGCR